jgi:putative phosphoesterase
MKRIGLLSDTHSFFPTEVYTYFEQCDEIWHAGDFGTLNVSDQLAAFKPLRGVYGNIDGHELRSVHPLHQRFTCEEMDIWITHIGGYPGKYNPRLKDELQSDPPDIFICGHSHILKVIPDKKLNLLHLNPGAAGHEGFHPVRTMIRFSITGKRIHDMEVIELGKRGTIK